MSSTRLVLACILITLLTIIGIINCIYTTQASQISSTRPLPNSQSHNVQIIGGRWRLVHASLGIELLPDIPSLPSHIAPPYPPLRIGFRRKKRTPLASLYFAHDALRVPKTSLDELIVSFRRIAHEESRVEVLRSDGRRSRARPVARSPTGIRKRDISTPH